MRRLIRFWRRQHVLSRLEDWNRRDHAICYIGGGYWGQDELYHKMVSEKDELLRQLRELS